MASMMMGMEFFFNNSSSSPTTLGVSDSLPGPGPSPAAPSTAPHGTPAVSTAMAEPPQPSPAAIRPGLQHASLPGPRVDHWARSPEVKSASWTSPTRSSPLHESSAASGSSAPAVTTVHNKDHELERKRARDRRSQQAMRDRNKWTIQTLTQQVSQLSAALDEQAYAASTLGDRVKQLEGENAHLRAQQGAAALAGTGTLGMPATPTNTTTTASTPAGAASVSSPLSHHHQQHQGPQQHYQETPRSTYPMEPNVPGPDHYSEFLLSTRCLEPFELPPWNFPQTCIADEIVQGFIATERRNCQATSSPPQQLTSPLASISPIRTPLSLSGPLPPLPASPPTISSVSRLEPSQPSVSIAGTTPRRRKQTQAKPDPAGLIYKDHQSDDEISNMVGGIIRSYTEIETLPKQVSVYYTMTLLVKWLVSLDAQTWEIMPAWLRPMPCQLQTPHAAWVDRIPWPRARRWLVSHPKITLDNFAATYSSSLTILWDFSHEHVLVKVGEGNGNVKGNVVTNPIFEQHIRQLKNWTVGEPFRTSFSELAELIELDRRDWS